MLAGAVCVSGATVWSQDAPQGKVVFSRSESSSAPEASKNRPQAEVAPESLANGVTDAERAALVFARYDFSIHLQTTNAELSAEVRTTVRNGGTVPLKVLPLQLGSTLHFEHIRAGGKALPFATHMVESDADHSGSLEEAAIALPEPLPAGKSVELTIDYSGTEEQDSSRLDRIGTPASFAARSDWDQVGSEFTGLRGFGNVVWYPVASVPALLGDGSRLFEEIARQKQVNADAVVSMHVTEEFTGGAPTVAVLDGQTSLLTAPASMPDATFPGVMKAVLPPTRLGFAAPGLFLATRVAGSSSSTLRVMARADNATAAQGYGTAVTLLQPVLQQWLPENSAAPLTLIDLPIDGAEPSQQGDALFLSLRSEEPSQLATPLSQALPHAMFTSPRLWLAEGVPAFFSTLWTEHTQGREKALEQLASDRAALALAEPATPGASAGQTLAQAHDPVFYRTKATYALWMLRELIGDDALANALKAYKATDDTTSDYFEKLIAKTSGQDVHWFFQTWVDSDLGLPDLAIANVFSSKTVGDQWLVALEVRNDGYAQASVPVTVRSASNTETVQLLVPARGSVSRRILLLGEPAEVDVNDGSVPEVEASVHRRTLQ